MTVPIATPPSRADRRLAQLVDRHLFATDAQYHAEVRRMENLLNLVRMGLEDEDVEPQVIDRVLNRIVYGTPSGADAYERIDRHHEAVRRAMTAPPPWPFGSDRQAD